MAVWIVQCLCPDRHCITAVAGEFDTEAEALSMIDTLRRWVDTALRDKLINPHCGLCAAREKNWHYELGRTKFATMAEAEPALREQESLQALSREMWGDLHHGKPN